MRACEICGEEIEGYNEANYLGGRKQYRFHIECYQYYRAMEPSDLGYEILGLLMWKESMPLADILFLTGASDSGASKQLVKLVEADFVEKVKRGVYKATIDGKEKMKHDRIQ